MPCVIYQPLYGFSVSIGAVPDDAVRAYLRQQTGAAEWFALCDVANMYFHNGQLAILYGIA